jgi:quinol monooxygenase YgiN
MIVRVFRAKIKLGKQKEYEQFVKEQAIPSVSKQEGVIAQYAGRPLGSNKNEFVFVSVWNSLEELKAYAGNQWENSVIEPGEEVLFEETAVHNYELFHKKVSRN